MRNPDSWQPTKFVVRNGRLRATSEAKHLSVASRLIADLVAAQYQTALAQHARGRLLDMGCGAVPLYSAYRDHVSSVTCIDWEHSAHGGDHIDTVCDLGGRIPYADQSFDTILLSDVLEHLAEPSNCWSEAFRLLAPGGKLILNVPFYYQIHEEPHDYYRYTEFALRRFADRSGFEVVELKPVGGAPEILADLTSKLLGAIRYGSRPAAVVQALAGAFVRTHLGASLSARTAKRFPFGYFMVAAKGQPSL